VACPLVLNHELVEWSDALTVKANLNKPDDSSTPQALASEHATMECHKI
jgi:hypothetical protein